MYIKNKKYILLILKITMMSRYYNNKMCCRQHLCHLIENKCKITDFTTDSTFHIINKWIIYRKINNTILYIKVHNIQQKLKKRKSTDSYIMSYIRVQSLQLMWGIVNNQQSHIYHIPCQNPAQIKQSHILCQNSAQIKQYHIPCQNPAEIKQSHIPCQNPVHIKQSHISCQIPAYTKHSDIWCQNTAQTSQ